ncbi:IS3 family transposase [Aldersonia sp. NBC_00410]|nr:IS3 family transposase [Aldersonia sp. NBC_00410]MCX5044091.1 IS3 family transposase [Aldersonia sp. NBC_00410]
MRHLAPHWSNRHKRRFPVVTALTGQAISIHTACRVLGISKRGYPHHRTRPPSQRRLRQEMLAETIKALHAASLGCYGVRRIHAELTIAMDIEVWSGKLHSVIKDIVVQGLSGNRKRYISKQDIATHFDPIKRNFAAERENQLCRNDITEHPTREGKVYRCAVIGAYPRRIVGWAIDSGQTASLVLTALDMAIAARSPNRTVVHRDHGTQSTAWAFSRRITDAGPVGSMGTIGDGYDNAMIESFWNRMQIDLLDRKGGNPQRARQRDLRLHRDLPQPATSAFRPRLAHPAEFERTNQHLQSVS